jgi:hypothetical protein
MARNPVRERVVDAVVANRPLAKLAVELYRRHQAAGTVPTEEEFEAAVAADPAAANQAGKESKVVSRTFMGNLIAFLGWLIAVLSFFNGDQSQAGEILLNAPEMIGMGMGVVGHVIAFIGRTVKGLKPMHWLKPWTWFGLGART